MCLVALSLAAVYRLPRRGFRVAVRLITRGDSDARNRGSRAVSPVVAVVLMVAVVVVIAASVGLVGLSLSEEVPEPTPNVAESTGSLEIQDGFSGGIVRITHVAGDSVPVSEIEIDVAIDGEEGAETARIYNLPATRTDFGENGFSESNLEDGDDSVISEGGTYFQEWEPGALHANNDNTLSAGSFFEFRIASGDYQLSPGDTITVRVIHQPSNGLLIEKELTA